MGETKNSYILGFTVLVLILIVMLQAFNWANNLTAYTMVISLCTGLFIGFLVTGASME
jgi:hypothetical protein